jgi:hypothetical protein
MTKLNIREAGAEAQRQVVKEMQELGRVPSLEWADDFQTGKATIAEMIGTDDGAREFIEKVTYEAYAGRENVPLVYQQIYTTLVDANFPKTMTVEEFGPTQAVFLRHFEGGEVKFGALGAGESKTVSFETWAAGFEYNEDIVEYNQTWKVSEIGIAFGEAYAKLLNHLHLRPIIETGSDSKYTTTGGGLSGQHAAQGDGTAQLVAYDTSIAKTLANALQVLPQGTLLLINSFDRVRIEQSIAADINPDLTPGISARLRDSMVEYDGATVTVGNKTYEYEGVDAGTAYLVVPKRQFIEYVKHDLRVDSSDGDLSRLILAQVVGRTRRAVLAGLSGSRGNADGAVKVDLTA